MAIFIFITRTAPAPSSRPSAEFRPRPGGIAELTSSPSSTSASTPWLLFFLLVTQVKNIMLFSFVLVSLHVFFQHACMESYTHVVITASAIEKDSEHLRSATGRWDHRSAAGRRTIVASSLGSPSSGSPSCRRLLELVVHEQTMSPRCICSRMPWRLACIN